MQFNDNVPTPQTFGQQEHMLKLCTIGSDRGPYPREFRPDEVICLDCGCVMPCTLQVEHRRVFDHAHYCWGGPGKVPS